MHARPGQRPERSRAFELTQRDAARYDVIERDTMRRNALLTSRNTHHLNRPAVAVAAAAAVAVTV